MGIKILIITDDGTDVGANPNQLMGLLKWGTHLWFILILQVL